LGLTANVPAK
jgi:hypothetical protein